MNRNKGKYPYLILLSNNDRRDDRLMVVVNGRPYYKSSGSSSSLRNTWLPFIMQAGTKLHHKFDGVIKYPDALKHLMDEKDFKQLHEVLGLPKRDPKSQPYYTIDFNFFDQDRWYKSTHDETRCGRGLIIKADIETVKPDDVDLDIAKLNAILKAYSKDDDSMNRICTKQDLIVSLRFGSGVWENEELKSKAMELLTEEEKKLASTTLSLEEKPEIETEDPDQINEWLIRQDASVLKELYELNNIELSSKKFQGPST